MGRRLRTQLPVLPSTLKPRVQDVDLDIVRRKEDAYRSAQQTTVTLITDTELRNSPLSSQVISSGFATKIATEKL